MVCIVVSMGCFVVVESVLAIASSFGPLVLSCLLLGALALSVLVHVPHGVLCFVH
jgi:hypothetical protein